MTSKQRLVSQLVHRIRKRSVVRLTFDPVTWGAICALELRGEVLEAFENGGAASVWELLRAHGVGLQEGA